MLFYPSEPGDRFLEVHLGLIAQTGEQSDISGSREKESVDGQRDDDGAQTDDQVSSVVFVLEAFRIRAR